MISEIRIVTMSVADLDSSIQFYEEAFHFAEIGRGTIEGKGFEKAWRMPPGMKGEASVIAAEGNQTGVLRLVQFNRTGEKIFTRFQDYGPCIVNFRARDLRALWPRLLKVGAVEKSPPTYWKLVHNVWDAQFFDPDGIIIDIFEIECDPDDPMGIQTFEVSEVQTMAIHVVDTDRSKKFYQKLGFDIFYDKMVENMEAFFQVPKGTKLHNVNLMKKQGSPNGRIELVQYIGLPGQPVRDKAVPPNIGILSISFETDNIEQTCELVRAVGGQEISKPVQVTLPFFGNTRLATYFGPDGEALEFYQRL